MSLKCLCANKRQQTGNNVDIICIHENVRPPSEVWHNYLCGFLRIHFQNYPNQPFIWTSLCRAHRLGIVPMNLRSQMRDATTDTKTDSIRLIITFCLFINNRVVCLRVHEIKWSMNSIKLVEALTHDLSRKMFKSLVLID